MSDSSALQISRLLLGVVIIVTLLTAIGFWLYHSPGHGTSIEHSPPPTSDVWLTTSITSSFELGAAPRLSIFKSRLGIAS